MPPYLAGRQKETNEFLQLLEQTTILDNMVLTGLRGVGKTVLLDKFKPLAIECKWLWVGTDLSESASVSEETIALRLITDLSVVTSNITIKREEKPALGFAAGKSVIDHKLNYNTLIDIFKSIPGLVSDKLKGIFELVWKSLKPYNARGIIFAYDEAQTMTDHAEKEQYPLSLLLDVFQSIQKKNIPFMLILTGLPTLFPKLVEARTFSERMFRVVFLDKLNRAESKDAIIKPIEDAKCPIKFNNDSIELIIRESGGYPYFIQFICREVYDVFLQKISDGKYPHVPIEEIIMKLDKDFFSGRWAKATDRQRELLAVIASLSNCQEEFTVQEVVEESKKHLTNSFSSSHVNQMLLSLTNAGLVYKNRHGKYSFAVPLMDRFILRQNIDGFAN
ncbi:MAG: ATP-binding protein [Nitrospirae bacterium]|nr:ATP-binding protein [Nitrospirota bacterium]